MVARDTWLPQTTGCLQGIAFALYVCLLQIRDVSFRTGRYGHFVVLFSNAEAGLGSTDGRQQASWVCIMVKILGTARLTRDMAQTLVTYFDAYAGRDGVVSVELSDRGLWLVNPNHPGRQFLGLADHPETAPEIHPKTTPERFSV
jgi:hypothetical protein